jgi:pterin-4a-carbinolamine dehydratase
MKMNKEIVTSIKKSPCLHLKKNQLIAQFIFSIFLQTLQHVSGISIAHHQEVHHMDTTIGTATQPGQQTVI